MVTRRPVSAEHLSPPATPTSVLWSKQMLRRSSSRLSFGTLLAQTTRNQPIRILGAKPARPWALAWGGKCALTHPTIGSAGCCARRRTSGRSR
jgi:hypothetical protein